MSSMHTALVSIEQLDGAILAYADEITEALAIEQAGLPQEGRSIDLLAKITEVLVSQQQEAVDEIVSGLLGLDDMIALAQRKADRFLVQKAKLDAARVKIRIHILNWIDANLPGNNRKLQGKLFFLRTQGTGGVEPLLYQESEVPREHFIVRPNLTLPAAVTTEQIEALKCFLEKFIPGAHVEVDTAKTELDEPSVRMALTAGLRIQGARLGDRGRHLRHSDPKKQKPRLVATPVPALAVET